jgi:hypothetical protein
VIGYLRSTRHKLLLTSSGSQVLNVHMVPQPLVVLGLPGLGTALQSVQTGCVNVASYSKPTTTSLIVEKSTPGLSLGFTVSSNN